MPDMTGSSGDAPLEVLRRWEDAGGLWRVDRLDEDGVDIVLLTCSAGEEMGRVRTKDPAVLALVAGASGTLDR
jgi:hypothetical protein